MFSVSLFNHPNQIISSSYSFSHLSHTHQHRRCHTTLVGSSAFDGRTQNISGHCSHVRGTLPAEPIVASPPLPDAHQPCEPKLVHLRVQHSRTRNTVDNWIASTVARVLLPVASLVLFHCLQHIHHQRQVVHRHIISIQVVAQCQNLVQTVLHSNRSTSHVVEQTTCSRRIASP